MKHLFILFVFLMTAMTVKADQNADIIKKNKITHSTTVMVPATTNLILTCLSNRNVILSGTFNGTQQITIPTVPCFDGTKFTVQHAGTGNVLIKNNGGTTLKTLSALDHATISYYTNLVNIITNADESMGGGAFDPNASPSIFPIATNTQTFGNASFNWQTLFTRNITSNGNFAFTSSGTSSFTVSSGSISFTTGSNAIISFNAGSILSTNDAFAFIPAYTLSLTGSDCGVGACTSAAPYNLPTLTPTTTCTAPSGATLRTCAATIFIELSNISFPSTTDKYLCIGGINYGAQDGQLLNIVIVNRSINVTNFVVGFASPNTPITGCTYQGDSNIDGNGVPIGTFKLKYSAVATTVAGGAFPAIANFLPRNQFLWSKRTGSETYYDGLTTYNTSSGSIGSIQFMFSKKDGWVEQ